VKRVKDSDWSVKLVSQVAAGNITSQSLTVAVCCSVCVAVYVLQCACCSVLQLVSQVSAGNIISQSLAVVVCVAACVLQGACCSVL